MMAANTKELKLTMMAAWNLDRVSELMQEGFDVRWTPSRVKELLSRDGNECVVATLDGEVIAFAIYCEKERGKSYYIAFFGVAPEHRRESIGTRFYGLLCEPARHPVRLMCRSRNKAGQAFWRSLGFKAVRVKRKYYVDPIDDGIEMTKGVMA